MAIKYFRRSLVGQQFNENNHIRLVTPEVSVCLPIDEINVWPAYLYPLCLSHIARKPVHEDITSMLLTRFDTSQHVKRQRLATSYTSRI